MMVIGLTGGIASGKSTVATMLRKANIPVVDADELAHFATRSNSPILKDVARVFGNDIIAPDGTLDRKKLADIVFCDDNKRKILEALLHPIVKALSKERLKQLEQDGHKIAVYMAPLIFETNLYNDMAKTILVVADRTIVLERAALRDQSTHEQVQRRLNAQFDDMKKRAMADVIVENNGTLDDLYENLQHAWHILTGMHLPASP